MTPHEHLIVPGKWKGTAIENVSDQPFSNAKISQFLVPALRRKNLPFRIAIIGSVVLVSWTVVVVAAATTITRVRLVVTPGLHSSNECWGVLGSNEKVDVDRKWQ